MHLWYKLISYPTYIRPLRTIRPSITDSHVRTVIKYDGDSDTSKNQSLFLGLPFPLPSHPSSLDVFLWRHTWHFLYLQISLFVENCLQYVSIHGFSVWLRTGYNPADINPFQRHTGNEKNMSLQWFNKYQREGGQWAISYTSPQSIITTFSYSLAKAYQTFIRFDWFVHLGKCPNFSTTNFNSQNG